ncbi:MAG: DUF2332 domain-containing protein [Propionicimonas sp.]|uniref:DUF2332 domain-containing protein n=1 Tax=Propionicimonas sp. TaxID=1955623 RepID=UPI002B1FEEB2|nr:DUF2332 domain-containing protein [Propionicimonas sp.]MEA4944928.1 DUF2332 domain-containing protein [Propionicimonas sp.]
MNDRVAAIYRDFADVEVQRSSPVYFDWACGVADDPEVAGLIGTLPTTKVQPNLVFAAARHCGAPVGPYRQFRSWLVENWTVVVPVVLARATQTNEAARCAVLLPILSALDGPLALIEAGAPAGLCLYPDRYSYRYRVNDQTVTLAPESGPGTVEIPCDLTATEAPTRLPRVAWRAGADLNPIAPTDSDQLAWLETLIWPEHDARRDRLRAAAKVVAEDPPGLVRGDILTAVPELIERAPAGTKIVVFRSAVLACLPPGQRQQFVELMLAREDVVWISNEGAGVLPSVTEQVDRPVAGRFIVAVDGRAVALAGPHGQSYEALT